MYTSLSYKVVTGLLLLTMTLMAQAGKPLWSFTPDPSYPSKITLNSSQTATIKYTVTNNMRNSSVLLRATPIKGIQASGCSAAIGPSQSCILTLEVSGATLSKSIIGGPVLCNISNPLQCYQPSQPNQLFITRASQPTAPMLSVTGFPLFLSDNKIASLAVTNTGGSTALNVTATLPAGLAAILAQDASECTTLAAGASCNLYFTSNNRYHEVTSVSVAGTNTNTITSTICVGPTYNPDGDVYAMARDPVSNTIYLGGDFDSTYIPASGGAGLNTSTGLLAFKPSNFDDDSAVVVADGSGGWFVGGEFSQGIVHLLSDGSLDPAWNANLNSGVTCIAVDGGKVYIGGFFTSIEGFSRDKLAALDATTGSLIIGWDPGGPTVAGNPDAIAVDSNTHIVYVGGGFTSIGGQPRNRIASFDGSTGLITSWDPDSSGPVYTLLVNAGKVYVGGAFNSIGGQPRFCLAALDTTVDTNNATSWDPSPDNAVYDIDIAGNTLYAGGMFTSAGGQLRSRLAALDMTTDTNNATPWNPSPNAVVRSISVEGSKIYVGGGFTVIGGQTQWELAEVDLASGNATSWALVINSTVDSIATQGSTLYVAGRVNFIDEKTRNNLAAIDGSTGIPTNWNPNANNSVYALGFDNGKIYAGGGFTNIGGQGRNRIAALDTGLGLATAWNPNASGIVRTLVLDNGTVYAGGDFTMINGQPRNYIAALAVDTGNATSWDPNANASVLSLAINGGKVYAGGNFTSIGGQGRNYLAAFNLGSSSANSWNPDANGAVKTFAFDSNIVYAGGSFTTIDGQNRNRIAALDADTGHATSWDPSADNDVLAILVNGSKVYAVGMFTAIGAQSRNYIAALSKSTGLASAWNPDFSYYAYSILLGGATLYLGGGVYTSFTVLPIDTTP